MKGISPAQALRTLIVCMIVIYGLKLLVGRVAVFYYAYSDANQDRKEYLRTSSQCEDHKNYESFKVQCDFAEKKLSHWVLLIALDKLSEQTYSCIEHPCTEIIKGLLESWFGIIFSSVLSLATFFFIFTYLNAWIQRQLWERKKEKQGVFTVGYEDQEYLRNRNDGMENTLDYPSIKSGQYEAKNDYANVSSYGGNSSCYPLSTRIRQQPASLFTTTNNSIW